MNREVEERIVAMYFDNKDFEKNAKTTIDTLAQLKEELNMEESASKGFQVFEKLKNVLKFDKVNQDLQKMKSKLTSMNGAVAKIFKIGNEPLREAKGAVDSLMGYINKVIGFDLANKIVSSVEGAFRRLTIEPIGAGWNQYESKMDSMRTIMSSTGESAEVVEMHMQHMTEYANKTVYSLVDMTSNLGKFTNNGVALDRAVPAMEGIANAAADAGQGAQQASMAMYNFSQAIGVGHMTSIDWKSIENANMATGRLKGTFLEVAAASGKVKKEITEIDGKKVEKFYIETDENGKKLKNRIEVTADNLRETLKYGWLDRETMLRTLQIYSGEEIDVDTLEAWGIKDKELQAELLGIGKEAQAAATEVRTFSKMMDALKESVQSGWAQSFEIIFGNMEEGTQLWTTMNEKIDGILSKSSEARNQVLKGWAEMTESGRDFWTLDEKGNKVRTGEKGGREILIDSVFELMDVITEFKDMASEAFSSVFGKIDSKALFDLTLKFRDFVNRIKEWLGSTKDSESRISKISKILKGVFSIIKAGINVIKWIINLVGKIASPIIDWLIDKFAVIGEFFEGFGDMTPVQMFERIGEGLKRVWEKVTGFFTIQEGETESPFVQWVKRVWEGFKETVHQWMNDLGLGEVWDTVSQWWENIKTSFNEGWQKVSKWWNESGIPEFFEGIWNSVVGWFTPKVVDGVEQNAPIVQFFIDIWEGMKTAWDNLKNWEGWKAIGDFFAGIWNDVSGWFTPTMTSGYRNGNLESWYEDVPIVQFFKGIWRSVEGAWNEMTAWEGWKSIGDFFAGIWNDVSGWFQPKFVSGYRNGNLESWYEDAPIVQFFKGIWRSVESAWNEMTAWEGWKAIGDFFAGVWNDVNQWFQPKLMSGYRNGRLESWYEDSPIVSFFNGIKSGVEKAWNGIVSWDGWQSIGKFFTDTWNWIIGIFNGGDGGEQQGKEAVKASEASVQQNEEVSENTEEGVSFLERIMGALGDLFEKIKGVTIPPEIEKFLNALGSFFGGLLNIATVVLQSAGDIMSGKGDLQDFAAIGIPLLIGVIGSIFDYLDNKHLAEAGTKQNFAQKFLELAGGLFLLATGVAILTTIDEDKMWKAAGVIAGLGIMLAIIIGVLGKLKGTTPDNAVTPTERILNNLINTLGKIGIIAVSMALLPGIIEAIGKAKKEAGGEIGKDLLETFEGLAIFIASVSLALALVNKLTGGKGIDPKGALMTAVSLGAFIAVMLGVMQIIGGFTDLIGDQNAQTLAKLLGNAAVAMRGLGEALGSFFAGIIDAFVKDDKEKIDDSKEVLKDLDQFAEAFDMERIAGISRIMTMINNLSSTSNTIDSGKMESFKTAMEDLARGILSVNWILEGVDDLKGIGDPGSDTFQRFEGAVGLIGRLIEAVGPMGGVERSNLSALVNFVNDLGSDQAYLTTFVENLKKVIEALGSIEGDDGIQFNGLKIAGNLYKAIQDGLRDPKLGKFDATAIVDNICEALSLGNLAIATLVHNMVQEGLNLSGTGANGEALHLDDGTMNMLGGILNGGEAFGSSAYGDVMLNNMMGGDFHEQLFGKDGKGGMLGEINSMVDQIPSMSSIFSDKGWMDFTDENGNQIDLVGAMQTHLQTLGDTLSEMEPLKVTITPVLSFDNLTPEAIQAQLNNQPIALSTGIGPLDMQVDFTGLEAVLNLNDIRTRLDSLLNAINQSSSSEVSAVNGLAVHMDGIASQVAAMKMYLDTGVLVAAIAPMIDEALYRRQILLNR